MVRRSQYPAGPLAFVAFGLFVLSCSAVRLWRSDDVHSSDAAADHSAVDAQAPAAVSAHVAISVATNTSPAPLAESTESKSPVPASPAALALDEYATMPALAETAPPVAARMEFDPVVTLEPQISIALEPALAPLGSLQLPLLEPSTDEAPTYDPLSRGKAKSGRAPDVDRAWPYPVALVSTLKQLGEQPVTAVWSREVLANIDALFKEDALHSPSVVRTLNRLDELSNEAHKLAPPAQQREAQVLLARASFGLTRRLLIWRQIEQLAGGTHSVSVTAAKHDQQLAHSVAQVEQLFASAPTWQDYLLLKRIRGALLLSTRMERGELARRVLDRLEASHLSDSQRQLMARPQVKELAAALETWAAEEVDYVRLLDALEQHEVGQASSAAHVVSAAYSRLRWSQDATSRALADYLNTYYRNANVRVAISGELLNRLLPIQDRQEEDVDDSILGARVFGRSQTSARLRIVLLPDMRRLKLGVEALGEVDSHTSATKGPATFYSQGNARYHARKLLSIDRQGLRVWRSQADVEAESELEDWETDYDSLPFIGLLARAVAKQQHDDNYHAANHEMRGKVAARAEFRFDHEINQHLAEAEKEFLDKLYRPLQKLQLDPTAVDLHTTNEYLIARYRVAGRNQMAAFTPRPAAPDSSVLNVQLHQSTLNNVLEQLKLDGRRTDLATLYREISGIFGQPLNQAALDELPERVTVQFAQHDAVRVACQGGKVMLVLKLAELSQGRDHKWKNFTVQAYYLPDVSSLDARLVRDGTIELAGNRLSFRDQIALRGIFTKVLSKDRSFNLVHEKVARDERLKDLKIDQFVIDDGWIGVSVTGPRKTDKPTVAREHRAILR